MYIHIHVYMYMYTLIYMYMYTETGAAAEDWAPHQQFRRIRNLLHPFRSSAPFPPTGCQSVILGSGMTVEYFSDD